MGRSLITITSGFSLCFTFLRARAAWVKHRGVGSQILAVLKLCRCNLRPTRDGGDRRVSAGAAPRRTKAAINVIVMLHSLNSHRLGQRAPTWSTSRSVVRPGILVCVVAIHGCVHASLWSIHPSIDPSIHPFCWLLTTICITADPILIHHMQLIYTACTLTASIARTSLSQAFPSFLSTMSPTSPVGGQLHQAIAACPNPPSRSTPAPPTTTTTTTNTALLRLREKRPHLCHSRPLRR